MTRPLTNKYNIGDEVWAFRDNNIISFPVETIYLSDRIIYQNTSRLYKEEELFLTKNSCIDAHINRLEALRS